MTSRIVRWRAGRSRGPSLSTLSEALTRARRAAGVSTATLAAASSMARGRPSRRAQRDETAAALAPREGEIGPPRPGALEEQGHCRDTAEDAQARARSRGSGSARGATG